MMNQIKENGFISGLTALFERSPLQENALHESDAEILYLPGENPARVALTIDTLSEEISRGLYGPYLAGWMTVMASMSDLAAVGARPMGIVISETLPPDLPGTSLAELQQGISEACRASGTYVLGGDTNSGERLLLGGCALGILGSEKGLSRTGSKPGDLLYSTGFLGAGNAFALSRLLKIGTDSSGGISYQPRARLHEGRSLCGIASACMDTSDGLLATLDQLMRLNGAGFELNPEWLFCLDPASLALAASSGIPPWLLLAGQHGEFELVFTVPGHLTEELNVRAKDHQWQPLPLGRVTEGPGIRMPMQGRMVSIDTERIRNLAFDARMDIHDYMRELLAMDRELQKGTVSHVSQ